MLDLPRARDRMVNIHVGGRGIHDREILQAMREVPREAFVDPGFEEFAYEDAPLPIAAITAITQVAERTRTSPNSDDRICCKCRVVCSGWYCSRRNPCSFRK